MSDEIIETLLDVFEQYMAEHEDLSEEQKFRLMDDLHKSAEASMFNADHSIIESERLLSQKLPTIVTEASADSIRLYSTAEKAKLTAYVRQFINSLVEKKVLTTSMRELILNHLMAFEMKHISLKDFRHILVLMLEKSGHEVSTELALEIIEPKPLQRSH